MNFALMMLGALALDYAFGWPPKLYARVGHPVVWLGRLISGLESRLNHGRGRLTKGAVTTLVVIAAATVPACMIMAVLPNSLIGTLLGAVLAWPLLAMRSLYDHIKAVSDPLNTGDMAAARHAVSMIASRDPSQMDSSDVARTAIESLAENSSDGILAPLIWGVIFGLPGLAAYKAVNTLDSMIGYRSERYERFGKTAARLDDLANFIPARLCGLLYGAVSGDMGRAWRVMRADAPLHRSPNAGWPEGAMAAALDIRLSGPRVYDGFIADEPWLNGRAPDPLPSDIPLALTLYWRVMALSAAGLLIMAVL